MSALLVHSNDATEAANSVANVCRFMARALDDGSDALDRDERDGARVILETCAETLERHFTKGGAA